MRFRKAFYGRTALVIMISIGLLPAPAALAQSADSPGTQPPPKIAIPEVKVTEKAVAGAKAGTGFLRTMASAIKFREKIRRNEQLRILATINSWGITDSIRASSGNIERVLIELKAADDRKYDSLVKLINDYAIDSYVPQKAAPEVVAPVITDNDDESEEPDAVSAALAPPPGSDPLKWEKLRKIRSVLTAVTSPEVAVVSGDTERTYKLRLARKAGIYGFYNAMDVSALNDISPGIYSGLVYDRVLVAPGSGHISAIRQQFRDIAASSGSQAIFTVSAGSLIDVHSFLHNRAAWGTCIADVLAACQGAGGVNLDFKELDRSDRDLFTSFVATCSQRLRAGGLLIAVTVPPYDEAAAFDIARLNPITDIFFADFTRATTSYPGPLAALSGAGSSLTTSVSFYLAQQLPPEKLVLKLPYTGIEWSRNGAGGNATISSYTPYARIRRNYSKWKIRFDEESASFFMDSLIGNGSSRRSIWFDNETTLTAKYDFILQNGLGGVAVSHLGDEGSYGELRDALMYKFLNVDSQLTGSRRVEKGSPGFWTQLSKMLQLYAYIQSNPCATCFDGYGAADEATGRMHEYIRELEVDSLVAQENRRIRARNQLRGARQEPLYTEFSFLSMKLQNLMAALSAICFLCLAVYSVFYIQSVRKKGHQWRCRSTAAWGLVVLILGFLLAIFSLLFVCHAIPGVGAGRLTLPNSARLDSDQWKPDCNMSAGCVNMPLRTLICIITLTAFISLLISRYLIVPLTRKRKMR